MWNVSCRPTPSKGPSARSTLSSPIRWPHWNNGVFGITADKNAPNGIAVSAEPVGKSVELDIQTLTTMLMGYKRPTYLAKIERIRTDRPPPLRLLEEIIPDGQPYFSDYF